MREWQSLEEVFEELEKRKCVYLILRNFEELSGDHFYLSNHMDIDFLVKKNRAFVRALGLRPRFIRDDRIHYVLRIAGRDIVVDVRTCGDGYYDKRWERAMLKQRTLQNSLFYVPDSINYYYSLCYHAILQKKNLSEDYLSRLNSMSQTLGINANSEEKHILALKKFLKKQNYSYSIPHDIWVPLRTECIPEERPKKDLFCILRDAVNELLAFYCQIKKKVKDWNKRKLVL